MRYLLVIIVALGTTSCVSVRVKSTHDPKVNFETFRTFQMLDVGDLKYQGPAFAYNSERIAYLQASIKRTLESKGFIESQSSPDLLIGFHIIVKEGETPLVEYDEMLDPYERSISYWEGYEGFYEENIYRFLKGSLVIDIMDSRNSNVVWQSIAQRYLEQIPDIQNEDIEKGIKKALKKFPPAIRD